MNESNLRSPFLEALAGRQIRLFHNENKYPHPLAGHSNAIRLLADSITRFLDAIQPRLDLPFEADSGQSSNRSNAELFRQVVYNATETFDFYIQRVTDSLGEARIKRLKEPSREYRATIKRHRDHWALICNLIKHEGNVLTPVTQSYDPIGPVVRGVGICAYERDALVPNRRVHPRRNPLGYAAELHRLLSDVLRCDGAAAKLAKVAPDDPEADRLPTLNHGLQLADQVRRVATMAPIGMGTKLVVDAVQVEDEVVHLRRQAVGLPSLSARIQVEFAADGVTRKFTVF